MENIGRVGRLQATTLAFAPKAAQAVLFLAFDEASYITGADPI
jgi:hypothetical protein